MICGKTSYAPSHQTCSELNLSSQMTPCNEESGCATFRLRQPSKHNLIDVLNVNAEYSSRGQVINTGRGEA